jgi:small-conductance mechanosensitive channel
MGIEIFLQAVSEPTNMTNFLLPLLNNAPAFAILLYFSWRSLKSQDKQNEFVKGQLDKEVGVSNKKDDEIKLLNEYIRTSEKETLQLLKEMNSVIDNLTSGVKINSESLQKSFDDSITELKRHIDEKILVLTKDLERVNIKRTYNKTTDK